MSRTEVLLCAYNGRAHLVEQLQSIERQTVSVDAVSIYDDASTDDTLECLRAFVDTLAPARRAAYRLHPNPVNLGYAGNFAQAIARAQGDILFLCDQDDLWEPDKVERLLHAFVQGTPDLVFSDGTVVDAAGRPLGTRTVLDTHGLPARARRDFAGTAFAQLLRRPLVNGAACAVRRAAAQAALPLPDGMPHDHWLSLWCAARGGVALVPQPLYRYRQHGGNVIGLGADRLLYRWLGLWHHPRAPRERELRLWTAATERLAAVAAEPELALARAKRDWLAATLDRQRPLAARGFGLLRSLLDGRYRRFAAADAPLRDLIALIRRA